MKDVLSLVEDPFLGMGAYNFVVPLRIIKRVVTDGHSPMECLLYVHHYRFALNIPVRYCASFLKNNSLQKVYDYCS